MTGGDIVSYEKPRVAKASFLSFALEQRAPHREGPNAQQDKGFLARAWGRSRHRRQLQVDFVSRHWSPWGCG